MTATTTAAGQVNQKSESVVCSSSCPVVILKNPTPPALEKDKTLRAKENQQEQKTQKNEYELVQIWGKAWAECLVTSFCKKDPALLQISEDYGVFQSNKDPAQDLPLCKYIPSILKHNALSLSALLHAMIYVAQIHDPVKFPLTSLTIHRVVLLACCVASKFYDDNYSKNASFARFGGGMYI
jgi:hypothetical protein